MPIYHVKVQSKRDRSHVIENVDAPTFKDAVDKVAGGLASKHLAVVKGGQDSAPKKNSRAKKK